MIITNIEDVEVGYFITYLGKDGRKIAKISSILYRIEAHKLVAQKWGETIVITDLFECRTDECFTTIEEIKDKYPEEFI